MDKETEILCETCGKTFHCSDFDDCNETTTCWNHGDDEGKCICVECMKQEDELDGEEEYQEA